LEPLVSNVIKHGLEATDQPVHIQIALAQKENRLTMEVMDDGPGYDQEKVEKGYGHVSIQERLALFFNDTFRFEIDAQVGKGVRVLIEIPLNHGQEEG
jgi:sensor histidine kinase YesM